MEQTRIFQDYAHVFGGILVSTRRCLGKGVNDDHAPSLAFGFYGFRQSDRIIASNQGEALINY